MSSINEAVVVEAEPEEVWRIIADARNLPRWNSHVREVRGAPQRTLEKGDTYRVKLRLMGVSADIRAEVLDIEPERFSEVRLSGVVDATVRTFLKPIGSRRSRLEHQVEYHFPGGPLGEIVARSVRHLGAPMILRRGLRAQKAQAEGA